MVTILAIPAVRFARVSRHFGLVKAVSHLHFEVADGEFFTILGPAGSGKTTCLRMIAGLDQPTEGSIQLYGQNSTKLPPFERDVRTVFQDYALFPHMTVGENIGYGLMIQKVHKAERERRVAEMLELVQLRNLSKQKPAQLSSDQKQRVALARALVNRPRVLLLDEPLDALDLKLRQQIQTELKAIQQQTSTTCIYATRDQEQALAISDRLAVFNHGSIEQIGTPTEIYERPETTFVAELVGGSNLMCGALARTVVGTPGTFLIRPEKIRMFAPDTLIDDDMCSVLGQVVEVAYLGIYTRYHVDVDGEKLIVVAQNLDTMSMDISRMRGRRVRLIWQREHMHRIKD